MTRKEERRRMREEMRDRRRMRRDGRNPYGSRGGYVRDSRRGDYNYDMARDYGYSNRERSRDYGYMPDSRYNYAGYGMDGEYDREHYTDYGYSPSYMSDYARRRSSTTGRYMRDRNRDYRGDYRDYASDGDYLSDEELMEWSKEMMQDVEEKDKQYFTAENIRRKSQEMGIEFDKFSFEEFYTTVLMMYTDYYKTLGTANMDIYLRLAKDWLCDEDAGMQYGEKLAAYYDSIVESE